MEMSGDPLHWHVCSNYNGIVGIPGEPSGNFQDQKSLPKSDEKINLKVFWQFFLPKKYVQV